MEEWHKYTSWFSWGLGGGLAAFGVATLRFHGHKTRKSRSSKLFYRFVGGTRPVRARRFVDIGDRLIVDVCEMLEETTHRSEARVLIPLVADLRKRGDRLVASKGKLSELVFSKLEKRVESLHQELIRLEQLLRALPKSKLTLEDVLAGKFETSAYEGQ